MVTFTLNAFSKSFIPLLTNHNYSIGNCKMEILLVGTNLSSIVDGTKIHPDGTNLAIQIAWKNKDGQAQC